MEESLNFEPILKDTAHVPEIAAEGNAAAMDEIATDANTAAGDKIAAAANAAGTQADPWMMNGATLAFIGDAVFGLMARKYVLLHGSKQPDRLHKHATALVNAAAQSAMITALMDELSEDELNIYKRGRNSSTATSAKHQTVGDYRRATGLEALFGYLYLEGRQERLAELFRRGVGSIKEDK